MRENEDQLFSDLMLGKDSKVKERSVIRLKKSRILSATSKRKGKKSLRKMIQKVIKWNEKDRRKVKQFHKLFPTNDSLLDTLKSGNR